MLPNAFPFYLFLLLAVSLYYALPHRWHNCLLFTASIFFYASYDWRFLWLLAWQIAVCYILGLVIGKSTSQKGRKWLLTTGVLLSLSPLVFFKYFNFLNDSTRQLCTALGLSYLVPHLNILLPLGISFYTFQSLGYLVDVYRRHIEPERDLLHCALVISFFPQIASGPIGRAPELLPQFRKKREFSPEVFESGLAQIIWGLFKKVVVADRLAFYVDAIYGNPVAHGTPTLCLAALFFSVQIYCDFSGYTDIAIGTARLFGIELRRNFEFPYISTSINNFWKRWHISLTSWFRDYLYIPLGGNRCSRIRHAFNVMVVFLLSGLWHGASWTFLAWGGMHGVLQLMENAIRGRKPTPYHSWLSKSIAGLLTFLLVTVAWIFFRAPDFRTASVILKGIFCWRGGLSLGVSLNTFAINGLLLLVFALWEIWKFAHPVSPKQSVWQRSLKYAVLLTMIAMFGQMSGGFIYQHF